MSLLVKLVTRLILEKWVENVGDLCCGIEIFLKFGVDLILKQIYYANF